SVTVLRAWLGCLRWDGWKSKLRYQKQGPGFTTRRLVFSSRETLSSRSRALRMKAGWLLRITENAWTCTHHGASHHGPCGHVNTTRNCGSEETGALKSSASQKQHDGNCYG